MAEGGRFTEIQHLHDLEVEQANVHGALEQRIQIARIRTEPAHDAMEFGGYPDILLIQHPGVLHVGGGALEAVEAEQAQPHDVFVDFVLAAVDRGLRRLGQLGQ